MVIDQSSMKENVKMFFKSIKELDQYQIKDNMNIFSNFIKECNKDYSFLKKINHKLTIETNFNQWNLPFVYKFMMNLQNDCNKN